MRKSVVFLILFSVIVGLAASSAGAFQGQSMIFTASQIKDLQLGEDLCGHAEERAQFTSGFLGSFLRNLLASMPCKRTEIQSQVVQEAVKRSI